MTDERGDHAGGDAGKVGVDQECFCAAVCAATEEVLRDRKGGRARRMVDCSPSCEPWNDSD